MTLTAMEDPADDSRPVILPVILTLNCPDTQRYLHPENDLLEAAYGKKILRLNVETRIFQDLMPFLFAKTEEGVDGLAKLYPDMSRNAIKGWIETEEFCKAGRDRLLRAVLTRYNQESGQAPIGDDRIDDLMNAIVVLMVDKMLLTVHAVNEPLDLILDGLSPNTAIFAVNVVLKRELPFRYYTISESAALRMAHELQRTREGVDRLYPAYAPLCMTCGTLMRPAGSCYVCEGCGSTSMSQEAGS